MEEVKNVFPNSDAVIRAVEKVAPSVVNISIVRLMRENFFTVVPMRGMGSGFVISSEGRILTDYIRLRQLRWKRG